jgi:UDP-N-acetylmuramoyl-tripeptide--D-alanyl-D-alanine ligase
VMEVSSQSLKLHRVDGCNFDIVLFTNFSEDHISPNEHPDMQDYFNSKLKLFKMCKTGIVNTDDLHGAKIPGLFPDNNITTYGIKNQSDFNARDIILNQNGSEFICNINKKDEKIRVPVGGEHFVLNSLCAIAAGNYLNIKTNDIIEGIEGFELTKKRMDIKELKNGVKVINDAYNASFESMKATLNYLSEFNENRKIAVLGDMFELGDFSKELHEKVGNEVVKNNIDILICNGKNSKYIISKAKEKGMKEENIYYFENREEILELLEKIAKKGDVILFKASNGMKFFDLANDFIDIFK